MEILHTSSGYCSLSPRVAVTFLEDKLPADQWPVLAVRVQKVADELSVRLHGRPAQ